MWLAGGEIVGREFVFQFELLKRLEEDSCLVKDFSGSTVVRFKEGKMNEEDIDKLKEFMDMVDKSNITRLEKEN